VIETGRGSDLQRLLALLLFAAGAWMVWRLSAVLAPFALAALFAYLGRPMMLALGRLGAGGALAATTTLSVEILILFATAILLLPLLISQAAALAEAGPAALAKLRELLADTALAIPDQAQIAALSREHAGALAELLRSGLGSLLATGVGVAAFLGNLVLVPVLAFYGLRDYDRITHWPLRWVAQGSRDRIIGIAGTADQALSAFLRGQLSVMAALAVIYAGGLWVSGLEYGIALGAFAGLVSFVPYLGAIVGIGLALLMALTQGAATATYIGVLLTFGVGQMLESMVLTPRLVGDRIGLHPVLVIFAVLAGGALFGFLGVLLALPASAVLVAIVRTEGDDDVA